MLYEIRKLMLTLGSNKSLLNRFKKKKRSKIFEATILAPKNNWNLFSKGVYVEYENVTCLVTLPYESKHFTKTS